MPRNVSFLGSRVARRIFLSFMLASAVPLAIFAVLAVVQVGGAVEKRAMEQLEELSRSIGQQVLDRLLIADDALDNMQAGGRLTDVIGIDAAAVIRDDGTTVQFGPRFGAANITAPSTNRTRLIVRDSAVFLATHTASGLLIGRVDAQYLWSATNLLPFGHDLCVFDSRSPAPLLCTTELPAEVTSRLRASVADESRGRIDWRLDGENHVGAHWELFLPSRFEAAPWSIVVSQRTALAYEARQAFNRAILPAAAAGTIVIFLLSILQIRRTLNPLNRLVAGVNAISRQEFDARIESRTGDEFGELSTAMNAMAKRLGRQFGVLTTFAEIDRLILESHAIENVLDNVLGRIKEIMPEMRVSVLILDEDDASRGRVFLGPAAAADCSVLRRVDVSPECRDRLGLAERQPVVDPNTARELLGADLPNSNGELVAIPLTAGERLRGALLAGTSDSEPPQPHEVETMRELARRLAVAVSAADRERDLFDRAHFDQLTGLPNRQLCTDRLEQALAHARREGHELAVLFIDLDGFKNVNDSLGHSVGDKLLSEAALRLTSAVREADTVARLGGDEYIVILPHVQGPLEVESIARKTMDALRSPYLIDGRESIITASVGAAMFPEDGASAEELLRRADTAMYSAKDAGRARCVLFSEDLDQRLQERLLIQSDLRRAMERQELYLVYQPQLDLRSGRPVSAEALLRWRHPTRGEMSPALFVPILEESGLIETVGSWVIERALADLRTWLDRGMPFAHVAVNLASRQLIDTGLVGFVEDHLSRNGLEGHHLEVELTEHGLVSDFSRTNDVFSAFRRMGVRVAIDDFGTGYSSLGYLNKLEFDMLKIDRTFVSGMSGGRSIAIVEAMLKIASALDKSVIAEGIESEEQRALLIALGCGLGQGFLFSPPLTAHDLAGWAGAWNPVAHSAHVNGLRRRTASRR